MYNITFYNNFFIRADEIENNKFIEYCSLNFFVFFFTFALKFIIGTDYQSYLEYFIPNELGKFKYILQTMFFKGVKDEFKI